MSNALIDIDTAPSAGISMRAALEAWISSTPPVADQHSAIVAAAQQAAQQLDIATRQDVKPYAIAEMITSTRQLIERLPRYPKITAPPQIPTAVVGAVASGAAATLGYLIISKAATAQDSPLLALTMYAAQKLDALPPEATGSGPSKLRSAYLACLDALPEIPAGQLTGDLVTRWVLGQPITPTEQTIIDETIPAVEQQWDYAPEPVHATPRDPAYMSEIDEIDRVARALGLALQPWQRRCLAVGTEYTIDPYGQRAYHYKRVLITVPRQSGKTTLLAPLRLHRLITRPAASMFTTAQTGQAARRRMIDMQTIVAGSPIAALARPRRSQGSEGITWSPTGSKVTVFAPTPDALHGETPIHVDLDEIWAYSEDLGTALIDGAILPAQITIDATSQIWETSTMGTSESTYMAGRVEAGRAGDPGMAYFEWSLPEAADPYDRAAWWQFHPALGNTLTEQALGARTNVDPGEWLRAYCNRATEAAHPLIMLEDWDQMTSAQDDAPPLADRSICLEVAAGATGAAIVSAWLDDDGTAQTRVLHQAPRTAWIAAYLDALRTHHGVERILIDGGSPTARLAPSLPTIDGLTLQQISITDRQAADAALLAALREPEIPIGHDGSPALRAAISCAVTRTRNGSEMISRDKSTGPVAALIAASIAIHAARHPAADPGLQIW